MTLDEAIKHAKEKASEQRRRFEDIYGQEEQTEAERKEAIACLDCSNEHGLLVAWLTELQERREADRWIPVSEKLPEYSGLYLVSIYELVTVANFTGTKFTDRSIPNAVREVFAWKPLPKPYESEATSED